MFGFASCDQVKQGLGGKVRLILSGAAPLSLHVESYLRVVTCAHVLQGYGMLFLNLKINILSCFQFLEAIELNQILITPILVVRFVERFMELNYFYLLAIVDLII